MPCDCSLELHQVGQNGLKTALLANELDALAPVSREVMVSRLAAAVAHIAARSMLRLGAAFSFAALSGSIAIDSSLVYVQQSMEKQ